MSVCPCCKRLLPAADEPLAVDLANSLVLVRGEPVKVPPACASIMSKIVEARGAAVPLETIATSLWGPDAGARPGSWADSVRVRITHLRQALRPFGLNIDWISTGDGQRGYRAVPL